MRGCLTILSALTVLVALGPPLVWKLGVELPQRRIDSGVEVFEGVERKMAGAALDKVHLTYGGQGTGKGRGRLPQRSRVEPLLLKRDKLD